MIFYKNARLEPLDRSHLDLVLKWRNRAAIRKVMFHDQVISPKEHLEWFERLAVQPARKVYLFYLNDRPTGVVQIDALSGADYEWGFYIGDQAAPKGAGTLMGYVAIRTVFEQFQAARLYGFVIDFNERSLAFHRKLGFCEQPPTERRKQGDKDVEVIKMCLTKEKWQLHKRVIEQSIGGLES